MLEYLAVCQLTEGLKGPILCLVGAPGVGKTSIGRSVAKTLSRKFHRYGGMEYDGVEYDSMKVWYILLCRISLGGTCDQSDIRGHR